VNAKDRCLDWAYAAAWRLIRVMPERAAAAVFRMAADAVSRRNGKGVTRLAANLRVVVGPSMPDEEFAVLVRDAMRSYARYWLEAFRLPSLNQQQRIDKFGFVGTETLRANAVPGRGSILVLPHSGNWDAAGAFVTANGMALTTVAERLKPEVLYQRFVDYRATLGMEIVPLTGGDRATLDLLAERLRAGAVVPLLADRDLSARGVRVTFFGHQTKMPAGPAILALRTGAPIYVVHNWYEPQRPEGLLSHEIVLTDTSGTFGDRVRRLTQLLADELALGIARHPADWHMLGKMFIDDDAEATPTGQASAAPAVAGTPTERADDTQPAASTVASPGSG
jgi:KDO2-lipid IV(A) lauroyltransferase